jgi:hypothetical protein
MITAMAVGCRMIQIYWKIRPMMAGLIDSAGFIRQALVDGILMAHDVGFHRLDDSQQSGLGRVRNL